MFNHFMDEFCAKKGLENIFQIKVCTFENGQNLMERLNSE